MKENKNKGEMIMGYVVGFVGFVLMVLTTTLSCALVPGYCQEQIDKMESN